MLSGSNQKCYTCLTFLHKQTKDVGFSFLGSLLLLISSFTQHTLQTFTERMDHLYSLYLQSLLGRRLTWYSKKVCIFFLQMCFDGLLWDLRNVISRYDNFFSLAISKIYKYPGTKISLVCAFVFLRLLAYVQQGY